IQRDGQHITHGDALEVSLAIGAKTDLTKRGMVLLRKHKAPALVRAYGDGLYDGLRYSHGIAQKALRQGGPGRREKSGASRGRGLMGSSGRVKQQKRGSLV
ncbi:unnamed protein product, partial [marine sediment metagenome]